MENIQKMREALNILETVDIDRNENIRQYVTLEAIKKELDILCFANEICEKYKTGGNI